MRRKKPIRLLVCVSDIHAGSTVGLLPPDFVAHEGQSVNQNAIQRWLWSCWLDANKWLDAVVGDDEFALVINGDATEGVHHRTLQVITPDIGDHLSAAIHILQPLAERAEDVFVVKGTEAHTGNIEEALGRELGAYKHPDTGHHSTDKLYLEVNGCPVVFHHHIGATSRTYLEASALSIHLINEQAEHLQAGLTPPRVLVTGHRHRFGAWTNAHGTCVCLPPWQGLTRYGHKVVPSAMTKPGLVVLDWRGGDPNALPSVRHRIYTPPPPAMVRL